MDALMAAVTELERVFSPRALTKSAATPITRGQAMQQVGNVIAAFSGDMDALVAAVAELAPVRHEPPSRRTCRPLGRSY
jgi:transposase